MCAFAPHTPMRSAGASRRPAERMLGRLRGGPALALPHLIGAPVALDGGSYLRLPPAKILTFTVSSKNFHCCFHKSLDPQTALRL
jgi:hypothetical protein